MTTREIVKISKLLDEEFEELNAYYDVLYEMLVMNYHVDLDDEDLPAETWQEKVDLFERLENFRYASIDFDGIDWMQDMKEMEDEPAVSNESLRNIYNCLEDIKKRKGKDADQEWCDEITRLIESFQTIKRVQQALETRGVQKQTEERLLIL